MVYYTYRNEVCHISFKTNEAQQISLNAAFLDLTERERKALKNSRAETFSEELHNRIDLVWNRVSRDAYNA